MRQLLVDARETRQNFRAAHGKTRHAQGVVKLGPHARPGVSRHGNVVNILQGEASLGQAVADRLGRKTCGVLHPIEAFLFHRRDQPAVRD